MTQLTRVAKLNLPSSAESDGRYWARTRLPHSGHRWTGVVTADESRSGTGVATGQHRTSADTPDTHSERSCGRNVDGMERRVAPSVLPFLLETSPADLRDDSASRGALSLPPTRPVTTSAPSGIPFTCRGGPTSLRIRPLLSLLYGPCRYGPRTSQPPVWRSGCGPSRDTVSEMRSPTGLLGSPV